MSILDIERDAREQPHTIFERTRRRPLTQSAVADQSQHDASKDTIAGA